MKKLICALLLFILNGCISKDTFDVVRKTPKQTFIPPGTVWLRDNLFIDETEISNVNWLEFVYWNYSHNLPKSYCDSMLPDSNVWGDTYLHESWYKQYYSNILAKRYYFRHPAFQNYPVVGISYKQAKEFCKWRSDRVNEYYYRLKNHIKNWKYDSTYNQNFPKVVIYRLPSREEWEYAASAGFDFEKYPLGFEKIKDKNNLPVSDTKEYAIISEYLLNDTATYGSYTHFLMTPVYVGKPNKFGIYNLLGNVSEIITDSTYKGLNYTKFIRNPSNDSSYNYKQSFNYSKPETWLGFRCVCDVLKQ